jgi:hypothetical protein
LNPTPFGWGSYNHLVGPAHLLEEVPHLGVLDLESLELLVDPFVPLQLFKSGPFTVQVGAKRGTEGETQKERGITYNGIR